MSEIDNLANQLSQLTGKMSSAIVEEINEQVKQKKIRKLRSELEKAMQNNNDTEDKPKRKRVSKKDKCTEVSEVKKIVFD